MSIFGCFFGHDWTQWEEYEQPMMRVYRKGLEAAPPVEYIEKRQKHKCKICGYVQDELV